MRVALCKRIPLWSAIHIHPVWRILSTSRHVEALDLFLHQEQTLKSIPASLRGLAKRIDTAVFPFTPAGRRAKFYRSLRDEAFLTDLRAGRYDIIVPDGVSIILQPFLDAANIGVLLWHYGWLPQMRGMNTVEWAAILGRPPATTLFFYDAGMDTGDIVARAEVESPGRSVAEARRGAHRKSLALMAAFFAAPAVGLAARQRQRWDEGRTYFEVSGPLLDLAEARLSGDRARRLRALAGLEVTLRDLPEPRAPEGGGDFDRLCVGLRFPPQDRQGDPADLAVSLLHFLRVRGRPEDDAPAAATLAELLRRCPPAEDEHALRMANEIVPLVGGPFSAALAVPGATQAVRAAIEQVRAET